MKALILSIALIGLALSPVPAEAKGCIKGAIAGHMAGHGKIGAVAGCITGRHEANKRDAGNDNRIPPSSPDHHS